jgi:hypothetical protein
MEFFNGDVTGKLVLKLPDEGEQMKKCSILIIALAMVLFGCSAKTTPNSTGMAAGQPVQLSATPKMVTDSDGLLGRATAHTENGYYEMLPWGDNTMNITFVDYATKSRVYLCNRPECTHHDESCPSWFSAEDAAGGGGLFTDGNYLYFMRIGTGAEAGHPETITASSPSQIFRMGLNGENREKILEFSGADSIWGGIAEDSGVFYFLKDSLVKQGDELTPIRQLVSFDPGSKKQNVIADLDMDTHFLGIDSDGFILKTLAGYDDKTIHTVFLLRAKTGEIEQVKQWKGMKSIAQVNDGQLYYLDVTTATLTATDIDTKTEKTVAENLPFHQDDRIQRIGIWDNHLMFTIYEHGKNTVENIHYYSIDLASGACKESALKFTTFNITQPVLIMAENSTDFLVYYNKRPVKVTTTDMNGDPYEMDGEEAVYGLISKQDYWNNQPNYEEIQNKDNFTAK